MEIKLEELVSLLAQRNCNVVIPSARSLGQQIVVLDRGFVYVGEVMIDGDFVKIMNAKNIRQWGTTQGLGELQNGPLAGTRLDPVDEVLVPAKAVIHYIKCKGF